MNSEVSPEEIEKVRNTPIAFIVGCGRSGTTLLQSLMNSHPNMVATPECVFILLFYPRFGKKRNWQKKDILDFIDGLYSLQNIALWLLNREELTRKLLAIREYADYPLLCKMVLYQMRKDKENVLVLIDKNPIHSIFINKLLRIFPEATFIHIVREPKDCVSAHVKRFNKKNIFFLSWYWKGFNVAIEKAKKRAPGIFYTIIYENFVKNPVQILQELCKFLRVSFDIKIMQTDFPETLPLYKENKTFERIKLVHEGLLSPINDSNIGKWKNNISKVDVAITDLITGPYAVTKYGYEREDVSVKISSYKLLKSKLQYHIWKAFTKLRFANYGFNVYYRKMKKASSGKNDADSNEIIQ